MTIDYNELLKTAEPLKVAKADRALLAKVADPSELGSEDQISTVWALLCWSAVSEPGDAVVGAVVESFGAAASWALYRSGELTLWATKHASMKEISDGVKRWMNRKNPEELARRSLELAIASRIKLIPASSEHYPQQLHDLGAHAPLNLWVKGSAKQLAQVETSLAIVGARATSGYGQSVAAELASESVQHRIPVVSGAAYGIDAAAHRGALAEESDLATIAVLAGGVDRAYPAGHSSLLEQISERGVVLSEVRCGQAPTRWRFLQRNRLIAALADATVVVEAGYRSGSLNTAAHAVTLGRPLGAVPGPITSPTSVGSHRLLREFDADCITNFNDVRELLGFSLEATEANSSISLSSEQIRVRDSLSARRGLDVAEIAARSGLAVADVVNALGMLRLYEMARNTQDGWRLVSAAKA